MFDEVAKGAKRIAERVVVAGTIGLSTLSPSSGLAQNLPPLPEPTIGTAGEIAHELCKRRGVELMRMPDCIRDERNRMVEEIGRRARQEGNCAAKVTELAKDPSLRQRGLTLLNGRSPTQYGMCNFLRDLTQ